MYLSCPNYNLKISWKSKRRRKTLEAFQNVEIKDKPHLKDELKLYNFPKSETWEENCGVFFFFFSGVTVRSVLEPPNFRGFTITLNETHHTWYNSSGWVIGLAQKLRATHNEKRERHPCVWRYSNPRPQKASCRKNPQFRPCGHWERLKETWLLIFVNKVCNGEWDQTVS